MAVKIKGRQGFLKAAWSTEMLRSFYSHTYQGKHGYLEVNREDWETNCVWVGPQKVEYGVRRNVE
ncbi:hypothetical protein HanPSC8_Chr11g0458981 [Helianthus annuus]|nr:hypothetical protein HanPSC8_Chr11g0458981 [Helianthus annuus]